jgi:hypothetical protein
MSVSPSEKDVVQVSAKWVKREFETLWSEIWFVLPEGDERKVVGANGKAARKKEVRGRVGWVLQVI